MARKKVNLQWIVNNTTRHAVYKRRYKSLMKKTSDLATLCGIKACMVVYGEGETQPVVWPSVLEAKRVLKKFKSMPDRFKKMQNQEDFLHSRISMLQGQVCKSDHYNRELETANLLHESLYGCRTVLDTTTIEELNNLRWMVHTRTMEAKERLRQLVGDGSIPKLQTSPTSPPQAFYTYTEMQRLPSPEQHQDLQQGEPANLDVNGGGLSAMVHSSFTGSHNG
ncbi:hypothetical protein BAE44_0000944 [Dichanthelium oligosanthes]|uniref:MADS-box domain-containing protein n=1 Tax=Dichanthelium oligosanthes TaxID=888268 RepID=A0A1E5WKW8_9POAL|nr:hypothetical protein BAE44_0000944 [Dichanthelium oligosanthes]